MSNEELEVIMKSFMQLTFVTTAFVLVCYIMLKLGSKLNFFLYKKRIQLKLKKYDLQKYEVVFNQKGLPVTLLDKSNNNIIFI